MGLIINSLIFFYMNYMKNLTVKLLLALILLFTISSCCNIRAKGSLNDKNIPNCSTGNASLYYHIQTKKGILGINQDIGMCGAGIGLIFPIPFPVWIGRNTCSEDFKIAGGIPVGVNNRFSIKYNNKIYNGIKKEQGEEHWDPHYHFKNINTEELKKAKDAVIIVKDGDEVIAELPFEWGVSVYT